MSLAASSVCIKWFLLFRRPVVTTPSAIAPLAREQQVEQVMDPVPQQFRRVREDSEATCARTDLIYIHPPPEVRRAITDPQKV